MNITLNAWNMNNIKKNFVQVYKKWNDVAECRDLAGNSRD